MNQKKSILWASLFGATFVLSGCGSQIEEIAENVNQQTSVIEGVVADGYLQGAQVCLDLNNNKSCEADEPSVITGSQGKYTLEATPEQIATASIIANAVAGVTIDSDTGTTIDKDYSLSAPIGKHEFVSPMTTLIQSKIDENPDYTPEQAETLVKTDLGITDQNVSLYSDFIKEGESDEKYKVIHQTAQVVARAIADFKEIIKNNIEQSGNALTDDDAKAIQHLVISAIESKLPEIYQSANQLIEQKGDIDPAEADKVTKNLDPSTVVKIDYNKLKEAEKLLDEHDGYKTVDATKENLVEFYKTAFLKLKIEDEEYDEEHEQYNNDTPLVSSRLEAFGIFPSSDSDGRYYARSTYIEATDALSYTEEDILGQLLNPAYINPVLQIPVTETAKGSFYFETNEGNKIEVTNISKIDLSGKTLPIKKIIEDYEGDATIGFEQGDVQYRITLNETAGFHLGNLKDKTINELCSSQYYEACHSADHMLSHYDQNTGVTQLTVQDLTDDNSKLEAVIDTWYAWDSDYKYYVKDGSTKSVAVCQYNVDLGTQSSCFDNTEIIIGAYQTGVIADGSTPYIAIPQIDFEDSGEHEIYYLVITNDGAQDVVVERDIAINGSAQPETETAYNLSAMKKAISQM